MHQGFATIFDVPDAPGSVHLEGATSEKTLILFVDPRQMGLPFVIAGAYFAVFALAFLWSVARDLFAHVRAALRMRHLRDDPPSSAPAVIVTLVHGTWARHATWIAPDSALCQTLRDAAANPVLFQRLIWSGRNSIVARRRAVERLVEHLLRLVEQWPDSQHYIVAHSHGGNIAFQALGNSLLHQRIRGLVCLSTPFLTVTPRDLGPVGQTALWWLPVVIVFYGGMFAAQQVMGSRSDTVGVLLLGAAVGAGFVTSRALARFVNSVVRSLKCPAVDPSKVLILRAAGDEASAALGAAHIVSWISGRLWLMTSTGLGRTVETMERWRAMLLRHSLPLTLLVVTLAVMLVFGLITLSDRSEPSWVNLTVTLPAAVLLPIIATLVRGGGVAAFLGRFVLAVFAAPFLLLIALIGISVGPELLAAGLLLQVTAEATPPGRWVVCQVTPRSNQSDDDATPQMMHSASYQSPEALEVVREWFADRARTTEPPAARPLTRQ